MVLDLYSFMELPEAMGGFAGQEDLKLPLTTVHSVHQEAAQLGKKMLATEKKIII